MVKCITELYDGIKFCVKCEEDEMTNFIKRRRGARQGCSLSPYLFNIFMEYIIVYISKDKSQARVIGTTTIPEMYLQMT